MAGLALAAAVLAVLTATALSLDDSDQRALFYSSEEGFRVDYGRGLVTAFLAALLLAAALHLSGKVPAKQPGESLTQPEDGAEPEDGPATSGWRRRRERFVDDRPPAPTDLTVEPTVPFARPEPPI
ncbi:hypothetical protein DLE60_06850 [Micromonospora globispora]|nr:hypothetical protein DLE60_06850 [Micromonospora globispora]